MAAAGQRGGRRATRLRQGNGDAALAALPGRLGHPAALCLARRGRHLAALGRAPALGGGSAAHTGWPRRHSPRQQLPAWRAAGAGLCRDLDADQARTGRGLLAMGAPDRRGASEVARLSRLSARASGPRRAGGLAHHLALRFRGEFADLARTRPSGRSCSKSRRPSPTSATPGSCARASTNGSRFRAPRRQRGGSRTWSC